MDRSIDFIIVARNESKYLKKVLDAIAAQDYPSALIRTLVIDNLSTDETAELARESGATVITTPGTLGYMRNLGIRSTSSEVIAFLDGHSVPAPSYAKSAASCFEDEFVGGCTGPVRHRTSHPLLTWLSSGSMFASEESTREHTVNGTSSSYPWLTGCNCIYLRKALVEAGPGNNTLFRLEDTDISWRVFLRGYQLVFEPLAIVEHFDEESWISYLRKHFNYGVGCAQLAHSYRLLAAKRRVDFSRSGVSTDLLRALRNAGYKYEDWRIRSNQTSAPDTYEWAPVGDHFRQFWQWSDHHRVRISPEVVYWRVDEDMTIVVIHKTNKRLVFKDSANVLMRVVIGQGSRDDAINSLCQMYSVAPIDVKDDVDDFFSHLQEERVLISFC